MVANLAEVIWKTSHQCLGVNYSFISYGLLLYKHAIYKYASIKHFNANLIETVREYSYPVENPACIVSFCFCAGLNLNSKCQKVKFSLNDILAFADCVREAWSVGHVDIISRGGRCTDSETLIILGCFIMLGLIIGVCYTDCMTASLFANFAHNDLFVLLYLQRVGTVGGIWWQWLQHGSQCSGCCW